MNNKQFIIAIDGPVASGKETIGIALAAKLNALYFYTGGMYRALTLACLRKNIDLEKEEEILKVLENSKINLQPSREDTRVFLDNKNITDEIFLPRVANKVPLVAQYPKVRKEMVKRQRELIKNKRVIVEGRDVATDIAPYADIKIHLTADANTRAKRRYEQWTQRGIKTTFEDVLRDTQERDRLDRERKSSPLTIASEAYVLDTTNLNIEKTLSMLMEKIKEKGIS